jgi:hypothetical protein
VPAFEKRLTIFNLDTLEPVGTIPDVGGNGATVCPNTGHGFTSDHPKPSMFDVKTMTLIKAIDVPERFSADGIYCDTSSDRVYIGSHPTKSLLVVDAKDGAVLGHIDLGGTPEQTIGDGKGTIYRVLQDRPGAVAVIDGKTMKVTKTYPFDENGGCNGLALDATNGILFAACSVIGPAGTPVDPDHPSQRFVILRATDGKILQKLPLAGSSDGAAFNPQTMEAFSTQGNGTMIIVKEKSPTSFEVEQDLKTWQGNGARTIAFEQQDGPSLRDGVGDRPSTAASSGGDGASRRARRRPRDCDSRLVHDHHGRQIGLSPVRDSECGSSPRGQRPSFAVNNEARSRQKNDALKSKSRSDVSARCADMQPSFRTGGGRTSGSPA